ncbi:hypothetical protein Tco_1184293 [Tanacetum coccineum]
MECQRENRTTGRHVRSMMSQTTLPKSFWDYALETVARIPTWFQLRRYQYPSVDTSLNHEEDDQEINEPQIDINPIRKSSRTRRAPDRMCLYIGAEEHELGDLSEPANYKAALLDPESKKWLNAMNVGNAIHETIAIAKDDGVTKGARHFRAKVHYLRETIKIGDVKIEKIDTDDNLADPFTSLAFPKAF